MNNEYDSDALLSSQSSNQSSSAKGIIQLDEKDAPGEDDIKVISTVPYITSTDNDVVQVQETPKRETSEVKLKRESGF